MLVVNKFYKTKFNLDIENSYTGYKKCQYFEV